MRPIYFCMFVCVTLAGCRQPARKPAPSRRAAPPAMTTASGMHHTANRRPAAISLTYSVQVPKDVPEKMKFHPKRDKPYEADAHAMYRQSHRAGWKECLQTYLSGKLTPTSTATIMQQFGLQQRADQAGYLQCRTAVFGLIKRHGAARVKVALTLQQRKMK